jgi:probable DNA metabolism protein
VSLLKILYANFCIYDCAYCVNRSGNDIRRAAFDPDEIVSLTIEFYRRNYIEGLFLSSGVMKSPDDTMERLVRSVKDLRAQGFNGYIHLKCVPHASRRLIRQAGRYADRLSVNIELPSEKSLRLLAGDKTYASVLEPMGTIKDAIAETREDRRRFLHAPAYAPAGQSTQLIIGASPESDYDILHLARSLYRQQALKRVYYSAYVPVGEAGKPLPTIDQPPLRRENRLYQADWLLRLYGFTINEVISKESPNLDLKIDPKKAFALRHPEQFPVDINAADREMILKVPGIGIKSANRIVNLRRKGRLRYEHLKQLGVVLSRANPFIRCDGLPNAQWGGESLPFASPNQPAHSRRKHLGTHFDQAASLVFVIDNTFDGLLTAIFEAYAAPRPPDVIEPGRREQLGLFEQRIPIQSHPEKSERVWKGLKTHLGSKRRQQVYEAYLSKKAGVETTIYRYVIEMIAAAKGQRLKADLTPHIQIAKLSQKVRREAHRMKGFVRFQHTTEYQYVAFIAPAYDVLPLIRRHFETRFADQKWIIYDTLRNYGLYFDRRRSLELRMDDQRLNGFRSQGEIIDQGLKEGLFQRLWKRYYEAANIPQRNNPKLHLRQLPRRYWQYLTEKN